MKILARPPVAINSVSKLITHAKAGQEGPTFPSQREDKPLLPKLPRKSFANLESKRPRTRAKVDQRAA